LYFLSVIYMNYMWVVKESFSHILLYLMDKNVYKNIY